MSFQHPVCFSVLEQVEMEFTWNPMKTHTHLLLIKQKWRCAAVVVPPQPAEMRADKLQHWCDTHRQRSVFISRHDASECAPMAIGCPYFNSERCNWRRWICLPYLAREWHSAPGNWTRTAVIHKSLPSGALQTKRALTGVVVQNKPSLRFLERGFTSFAVISLTHVYHSLKYIYCE